MEYDKRAVSDLLGDFENQARFQYLNTLDKKFLEAATEIGEERNGKLDKYLSGENEIKR